MSCAVDYRMRKYLNHSNTHICMSQLIVAISVSFKDNTWIVIKYMGVLSSPSPSPHHTHTYTTQHAYSHISSTGGSFMRNPPQSSIPPLTHPSTHSPLLNRSRDWLYTVDTRNTLHSPTQNSSLQSPSPANAVYSAVAYITKIEAGGENYYFWQVKTKYSLS